MSRQISIAYEPNRLKMIWQSSGQNRKKFVVGELVRSQQSVSLSYFWATYDFAEASSIGFQGHPAFSLSEPVHHNNVVEVFSKRLPPRNRNDFHTYLQNHRLELYPDLSNFALLGYTGGYLPGDGFSFAIDFWYQATPIEFLMEISGFRYHAGMGMDLSDLQDCYVTFLPEPDNQHDPYAVKVMANGLCIGYVPRYYTSNFLYWGNACSVISHIDKIDGAFVKPQVYLRTSVFPKDL